MSSSCSFALLRSKHGIRFTFVFLLTFFSIPFIALDDDTPNAAKAEGKVAAAQHGEVPEVTPTLSPIEQMIADAGQKYQVDPDLIRLVIKQESGFKATARSPKNAQGIMQTTRATAQRFGIKNTYDPKQSIEGGTRYLSWLLKKFDGNVELALAGYNAGENTVIRYGNKVPPYRETRQYVSNITSAYGKTWHEMPASESKLNKPVANTTQPQQSDKLVQSQNVTKPIADTMQ